MLAGLLITLREGLEAALIVGIVLGLLRKLGRMDRSRPVWLGVIAAVLTSIVAGLGLNALGMAFEGRAEAIFEGAAMLLAAGVLTWMIHWMQRQGSRMRTGLEVLSYLGYYAVILTAGRARRLLIPAGSPA